MPEQLSVQLSAVSSDFPEPDESEWLALVEKTLKGKPFAKAMQTKTRDGIIVQALGTADVTPVSAPPARAHGDWLIASPHWASDAATVNRDVLEDLERGASAIAVAIDDHGDMGLSAKDLGAALEGVYLDMVPVTLIQGESYMAGAAAFEAVVRDRNHENGAITGCLGIDPIGCLARTGRLGEKAEDAIAEGAGVAREWSSWQPRTATFTADGTVYANAGASEGVELAAALSCAVQYLRAMEKAGLPLQSAGSQIQFTFSAGTDLWLTIAKFRAARLLWRQILRDCGVEGVSMKLNAVSAVHQISMKDPWVNILRGTAACFAAALGGADTITTLPHDLLLGTTDKFSRRIARNIQIILMEESSLAKVADPAAGSFALERLTADLAETGAELFRSIEAGGGILTEIRNGKMAQRIAEIATDHSKNIRKRKAPITGVSEFPDIHEKPPAPVDFVPANKPEVGQAAETATPLAMQRYAQDFETLRFRSDAMARNNGARPKVALINMGTPADFTARATFAKNFFEAGGIEALAGVGVNEAADAVREFEQSGAEIAILCGTDEQYDTLGVEIAKALSGSGCRRLYLAGKTNDRLAEAGVDDFAFMGCDVVDVLEGAYGVLDKDTTGDAP